MSHIVESQLKNLEKDLTAITHHAKMVRQEGNYILANRIDEKREYLKRYLTSIS